MAVAVKVFLLTFSALFPIVDPLAGSPIFLAMTQDYPAETRRALSWRVAMNSLLLMVGSYFVGAHILGFFGVSLPVVQVGGGLIVVSVGWNILLEKDETPNQSRRNVTCSDALHSAFYPLTLPLTVGPGSISVAVTLGANATHRYGFHIAIVLAALIAMAAVAITILLCYGLAARPRSRTNRDDRDREAVVVSAGVHWCPDHMERDQRPALLRSQLDADFAKGAGHACNAGHDSASS